ncbi:MAG: DUF2520 domain-containing protein [Planctomycetes bacterium]|nr:DUF2520 domain-containing protein [Planctomycetota bacterium]
MTSTTSSTSSKRAPKGPRRAAAPAVGLVGVGRLGSYVLHRLRRRGVAVQARRGDLAALARTRLVYLCVPEDRLRGLAVELAQAWAGGARPRVVLHAAGHLGADVLAPLATLGIATGVLHPMRAFSHRAAGQHVRAVQNCWTCAGAAEARRHARRLVRVLEPRAQVWERSDDARSRRLYHAGCVLANNGGLALHQLAARLLVRGGLAPRAADQGAAALLNSAVFRGARQAVIPGEVQLRGPLARGQHDVVEQHLRALRGDALTAQAYRSLSLVLLELARQGRKLDAGTLARFQRLLR